MKPKKSHRKYNYDQLSPVEVYQLILDGKIKKFPDGTWDQPDSVEYAAEIVRYWIEHILEWSDEDIKKGLSAKLFYKYKLGGLLHIVFGASPYQAINAAYPGRFKEWELQKAPLGFWTKEKGIKAVKWLIEEKLNWSIEEVKKNLSQETFSKFGLSGMLYSSFNNSPFQAVNTAYPGQFKECDLHTPPNKYWTHENSIAAMKWLIEEKLQWNDEDIKKNLSQAVFLKNQLAGPFVKFFNNSPFQVIEAVYPGRFKEWELPRVPINFWTKENGIQAVKWLIEEKLQWTEEEIKRQISRKVFVDNGLRGLINLFHESPFKALDSTYPGRFKAWELSVVPKKFWTKENAVKAMKWLIEEKLQWSEEDIKQQFSIKTFRDNGLTGLSNFFNESPFKALDSTYPGRFKEWELPKVPRNYWTEENAIRAIKWLIEEKLKWPDEEIKRKISGKVFKKHGLDHPLIKLFNQDVFKALNATYPGKFNRQDLLRIRKKK